MVTENLLIRWYRWLGPVSKSDYKQCEDLDDRMVSVQILTNQVLLLHQSASVEIKVRSSGDVTRTVSVEDVLVAGLVSRGRMAGGIAQVLGPFSRDRIALFALILAFLTASSEVFQTPHSASPTPIPISGRLAPVCMAPSWICPPLR
jgi:hypothetical protein